MNTETRLLRDLRRRLTHEDPSSVVKTGDYTAIFVHPTADDLELLARIGGKPEKCRAVDCWVLLKGSVYLVEIWDRSVTQRKPGVYYREDQSTGLGYLQIAAEIDLIRRPLVLAVLDFLADLIEEESFKAVKARKPVGAAFIRDLPPEVLLGAK